MDGMIRNSINIVRSFTSCIEVGCISVADKHLSFTTHSKELLFLGTTVFYMYRRIIFKIYPFV